MINPQLAFNNGGGGGASFPPKKNSFPPMIIGYARINPYYSKGDIPSEPLYPTLISNNKSPYNGI